MATIKDVADKAGVSTTTVSYIINGTAGKHKISEQTQQRVVQIMKELKYIPKASTKKSLAGYPDEYTIAVYLAREFKNFFLHRILDGINQVILETGQKCRMILCAYEHGKLSEEPDLKVAGRYHGAIIVSASPEDIKYLETQNFLIPIILFNRRHEKFSSVVSDNTLFKTYFTGMFKKHHVGSAGILTLDEYTGFSERADLFLEVCRENAVLTKPYQIFCEGPSVQDGQKAVSLLLQKGDPPDLIFCATENLAAGLKAAMDLSGTPGVRQIRFFAVAVGETDMLDLLFPELSYVRLPLKEMGKSAMRLLLSSIQNPSSDIRLITQEPYFHPGTTA